MRTDQERARDTDDHRRRNRRRSRRRKIYARYDFAFASGAPRKQIMELASLAFVERFEKVRRYDTKGVSSGHVILFRAEGARTPPTPHR